MRLVISVACFAAALLASPVAQAAAVFPQQGDLSINHGQGFQKVNDRTEANVGDSLMVGPNGYATVIYPDGCAVAVKPGAVVTVAERSPCASESYAQDQSQYSSAAPLNSSVTPLIIGAGIAGVVGAFAIYEATRHSPASP